MKRMPRHTLVTSIAGVFTVFAYAAVAALQILVLNPLAAAPGMTSEEIHVAMAEANESLGHTTVFFILGIGVALAIGVASVSIVTKAPPIVPGMTFLAILMFGAVAYFAASFPAGMGLADTFGISGGDHSPWARPLYAVSALAAILVIVGGIITTWRNRSASAIA